MPAKTPPEGFNTVSAYIIVKDPAKAIEWYGKAFGAEKRQVMEMPGAGIVHAELAIGDSTVMLSAENPQWGTASAETLGGSPITLHIYVADVDAAFQRAIDAGATATHPVADVFWGDRFGKLKDPFGLEWSMATHLEDLTPEQMAERGAAAFKEMAGGGGA